MDRHASHLRLCTLVPALIPQQLLVGIHVQAVKREEGTDSVRDGSLYLMGGLELFEPVHGTSQPKPGGKLHQAQLGVNIGPLLGSRKRVPCLSLQFGLALSSW